MPESITKDWLNDLLWENGTLTEGRVTSVVLKRRILNHHSNIMFLQVTYSSDVLARLPEQWVLKIRTHFEGKAEIDFYQQAAAAGRLNFLPRAGAFKSWDSGETVLLLENLKNSYKLIVTDQQVYNQLGWRPVQAVLLQLTRALARFHACWWNQPELDSLRAVNNDENLASQVQAFKDQISDEPGLIELVEQSEAEMPRFIQRGVQSPVSLVHGDCFPWHFFLERTGERIKLFDFEFATAHTPAYDLVSLLSYWRGDYLRIFQKYHAVLVSQNIQNYEFKDLLADIKLAIAAHSLRSVQEWHRGCSEALWKTKLTRLSEISKIVDNL